jgi:hypothetical protein
VRGLSFEVKKIGTVHSIEIDLSLRPLRLRGEACPFRPLAIRSFLS